MCDSKVSIIVPVYKVEQYLHRCVDSILAQTFMDFEVILVDDGSPDNCGKICDEYAEKDTRVHVIHQDNGGLSAARNAGIDWSFENSESQWLTFVDSDDWVHPQYLEILSDTAVKTGTGVVVSDYKITDHYHMDEPYTEFSFLTLPAKEFFCEHNTLSVIACGKLYKKEYFSSVRYPVGRIHEDEFTTYKIILALDSISYIPVPLYYYFYNESGITKLPYSLKKLDAVDALRERFFYVRRLDNDMLTDYCLRRFAALSEKHILLIKESSSIPDDIRERTICRLKRGIRRMLLRFGFRNRFWRYNFDLYADAFPILKLLYKLYSVLIKDNKSI